MLVLWRVLQQNCRATLREVNQMKTLSAPNIRRRIKVRCENAITCAGAMVKHACLVRVILEELCAK